MIRALLPDAEKQAIHDSVLDVATQLVIDELSGEILDEAPWYVSVLETPGTITAPGYIALSTLAQRFYRMQKVTRDSQEFGVSSPHDVVTFDNVDVTSPRYTYAVMGSQLWLFPLDTTLNVELRYSYLPAAFTTLADTDVVPWPDGFDSAYVHEAVARLTGDVNWTNKQHAIAQAAFDRLKSRVRREYVGPGVMQVADSPITWGSD